MKEEEEEGKEEEEGEKATEAALYWGVQVARDIPGGSQRRGRMPVPGNSGESCRAGHLQGFPGVGGRRRGGRTWCPLHVMAGGRVGVSEPTGLRA